MRLTQAQRLRRARIAARLYAIEGLRSQDMPEWRYDHGLVDEIDDAANDEFMRELNRIAERIERSLSVAGRKLLEATRSEGDT